MRALPISSMRTEHLRVSARRLDGWPFDVSSAGFALAVGHASLPVFAIAPHLDIYRPLGAVTW